MPTDVAIIAVFSDYDRIHTDCSAVTAYTMLSRGSVYVYS